MADHHVRSPRLWIGLTLASLAVGALPAEPEFGPPALVADGHGPPVCIRVADLDRDGDQDVVMGHAGRRPIFWYENQGGGVTFQERSVEVSEVGRWGVEVADINGDGAPDILSTSISTADGIYWLESDGEVTPHFTERTVFLHPNTGRDGPRAVRAADFDGDGDMDIASVSDAHDFVGWHENLTGDGLSWETHAFAPLSGAFGISTADLDGDGDPDLLVAARDAETISWYENNEANFTRRTIATGRRIARFAEAGDFDGDGDLDVASSASGSGYAWHRNDGGTPLSFTTFPIPHPAGRHYSVRPADFDGDGDLDIVTGTYLDQVVWLENDGGSVPSFAVRNLESQGTVGVHWAEPGDLDGDGDLDIVFGILDTDGSTGWVYWQENNPTHLAPSGIFEDHSGDGVNMPGEPGALRVTVANEGGDDVSGVVVSVESLTEGLVFEFTEATIVTLLPTDSITVEFPYGLDHEIECGVLLQAALHASVAGATAHGLATPEPVGGVIDHTVLTSSLPRATIPDGDSDGREICVAINAPDSLITTETLQVAIEHPHRGDLLVEITAPNGQTVTVFEGEPSDAGTNLLATYNLGDLIGGPADGDHCLRIVDRVEGNRGQISALTLEVGHRGLICEPWDPSSIIQVLLGEEAPAPWLDYTSDGTIDAADLVTGIESTNP